jgi:hypothetical protein
MCSTLSNGYTILHDDDKDDKTALKHMKIVVKRIKVTFENNALVN